MIEHLMSSSLSGDHQGCAAGFIGLHVRERLFIAQGRHGIHFCGAAGGDVRGEQRDGDQDRSNHGVGQRIRGFHIEQKTSDEAGEPKS